MPGTGNGRGKTVYKAINPQIVETGYQYNRLFAALEKLNIDAELAEVLAFGGSGIPVLRNYFSRLSDAFWRKNGNRILFSDLIKLFREAGFTKGIILFDELEKVFPPLNRKERRIFVEAIRY